MAKTPVTYADDEPNGLASMIGGLIEANLHSNPGRVELLRPAVVAFTATDAEASAWLRIARSGVVVVNGRPAARVDLGVRALSADLIALAAVPLRMGLPNPARRGGRAIIGKLLRGRIRVSGLLRHPLRLARLTRLLSVT